jgi:hypothetical protein
MNLLSSAVMILSGADDITVSANGYADSASAGSGSAIL